ncbi:MAG TPA: hypothetical protein VJH20_01650 [Candidatus Nanoarchaeia archaeon]|nr:hypothetical protein [Candidatus Nanoarchaeia archaeon]
MKKAISVLLSWVLIVGFAVAMSAIIFGWAIPFVEKVSENLNKNERSDIYCDNVAIKIKDVCRSPDAATTTSITVKVLNTGSYNLKRLAIARETEGSALQSCFLYNLETPPNNQHSVEPGNELQFRLAVVAPFTDSRGNPLDCNSASEDNPRVVTRSNVTKVEVVPWINIEGVDINCPSSIVTIKDINILNHECL